MSEREQLEAELASVEESIEAVQKMDSSADLFDITAVASVSVVEQVAKLVELYSRKAEIEQRLADLA